VAHPEPNPVSDASSQSARPAQDEWGFYDPEQAGFEAVIRRLMERADQDATSAPESPSPAAAK